MIHCSSGIDCPTDLSFLYNTGYVRRAGIIPFIVHNEITYILIGLSKEPIPVWADLGGRSETGETTLETAIREFGEESRYVMPILLDHIDKILITDKNNNGIVDQVILMMHNEATDYNININKHFQNTVPKTVYEDEMHFLQWIPYKDFLSMDNLTNSLKSVQKLLKQS